MIESSSFSQYMVIIISVCMFVFLCFFVFVSVSLYLCVFVYLFVSSVFFSLDMVFITVASSRQKWIIAHLICAASKNVHFTCKSSYCFQRILAIAILSVRLSVTRVDQAKMVQARITKFSPSAARKTLVSGTVKLFHKFEGGHTERGR